MKLFGPEQPNPPGLELMQQGQLPVLPLGPLFDGQAGTSTSNANSSGTPAEEA